MVSCGPGGEGLRPHPSRLWPCAWPCVFDAAVKAYQVAATYYGFTYYGYTYYGLPSGCSVDERSDER
eukprot:scaffold60364_cov58-Phaeocystis_antarctica.AAC.5